jgi:hypothetical protein
MPVLLREIRWSAAGLRSLGPVLALVVCVGAVGCKGEGGAGTGGGGTGGGAASSSGTGGGPAAPTCDDAARNGAETDIDCGGPACAPCAAGKKCWADSDCANGDCSIGHCAWHATCPEPPPGPTGPWADCSVGLDPTKNGGELLWVETLYANPHPTSLGCLTLSAVAVGPTGEVALGTTLPMLGGQAAGVWMFSGSGALIESDSDEGGITGGHYALTLRVGPTGRLAALYEVQEASRWYGRLWAAHAATWTNLIDGALPWGPPFGPAWEVDGLGNVFAATTTDQQPPVSLDDTLPPFAPGHYLVRGGAMGESAQTSFSGSFVADQTGGLYRFDVLPAPLDLGCGPMLPSSPTSSYLARFDASWACTQARVLPVTAAVLADGSGGVILSATATTALDLGCGALPAAPGGSTFVTRLDDAGNCVFGRSLSAPGLTVGLAPQGRILVSGLGGAAPIDLGGGPLLALGAADEVIGVLDAAGDHVWSRRFGGPGVTFAGPRVSASAAGDVYLLTGVAGSVDLGGGVLQGTTTVVGSYSPSGAHRWSRAFPLSGAYQANIDGCGALVVVTMDASVDPGCGNVLPEVAYGSPPCVPSDSLLVTTAILRFQP